MCYLDKARKYVRMDGKINFVQRGGAAHDVPYVMARYGAMPEEAYPGLNYGEEKHAHAELFKVLQSYLDAVLSSGSKRLSTAWEKGFEAILDNYFGPLPETFEYKGKTYTPRSFAESLGIDTDRLYREGCLPLHIIRSMSRLLLRSPTTGCGVQCRMCLSMSFRQSSTMLSSTVIPWHGVPT